MRAFRQCPSCGQARDAHELRCICGALLAGVDLWWAPDLPPAAGQGDANASPRATVPPPPTATVPPPPAATVPPPPTATVPPSAPAAIPASTPTSVPASTPALPLLCGYADCAQPNPPGAVFCQYCNRPLGGAATLVWPWGEQVVDSELLIGRESPAPQGLIERLDAQFDNVSRRHAMLRVLDGALWIEDLGSMNGTFLNGVRLAAHQAVRVPDGASLRFAARLVATVRLRTIGKVDVPGG
jgi:hypothetical protein